MDEHHHEAPGAPEGVAVDVGQGMGALVVYAPAELSGFEIELSPAGAADRRVHAVFHRRQTGDGHLYAAVFPSLAAGSYELWGTGDEPSRTVVLRDGETTEVHLPGG